MLNYHGKLMNAYIKNTIKVILVMIYAIQKKLSYQLLKRLFNQNQKYLAKENNSKKLWKKHNILCINMPMLKIFPTPSSQKKLIFEILEATILQAKLETKQDAVLVILYLLSKY
jgi:hypothetical protein